MDTDPTRREAAVVADVTAELSREFGEYAAGAILATVVRCVAELRRVSVTVATAASADDFVRAVTEMARHRLAKHPR